MQIERLASRRFAFLRLREQAHTSKRIHKVQKKWIAAHCVLSQSHLYSQSELSLYLLIQASPSNVCASA